MHKRGPKGADVVQQEVRRKTGKGWERNKKGTGSCGGLRERGQVRRMPELAKLGKGSSMKNGCTVEALHKGLHGTYPSQKYQAAR